MRPVVQLHCKKLDVGNVEDFLRAGPGHIGWQINLSRMDGDGIAMAVERSAALAEKLRAEGVTTVFPLHPSTDARPWSDRRPSPRALARRAARHVRER